MTAPAFEDDGLTCHPGQDCADCFRCVECDHCAECQECGCDAEECLEEEEEEET